MKTVSKKDNKVTSRKKHLASKIEVATLENVEAPEIQPVSESDVLDLLLDKSGASDSEIAMLNQVFDCPPLEKALEAWDDSCLTPNPPTTPEEQKSEFVDEHGHAKEWKDTLPSKEEMTKMLQESKQKHLDNLKARNMSKYESKEEYFQGIAGVPQEKIDKLYDDSVKKPVGKYHQGTGFSIEEKVKFNTNPFLKRAIPMNQDPLPISRLEPEELEAFKQFDYSLEKPFPSQEEVDSAIATGRQAHVARLHRLRALGDVQKDLKLVDRKHDLIHAVETQRHPFFRRDDLKTAAEEIQKMADGLEGTYDRVSTPAMPNRGSRPRLTDIRDNKKNTAIRDMHKNGKTSEYVSCADSIKAEEPAPVETPKVEVKTFEDCKREEVLKEAQKVIGEINDKVAEANSALAAKLGPKASALVNVADFSKVDTVEGIKLNFTPEATNEPVGIWKDIAEAQHLINKFEKVFAQANTARIRTKKTLKTAQENLLAGTGTDAQVEKATMDSLEAKREYAILKKLHAEAYKMLEDAKIEHLTADQIQSELNKYIPRPSIAEQLAPLMAKLGPTQEQLERSNPGIYKKRAPLNHAGRQATSIDRS
jgi:hypothetical protein